jgi:hypothetical protein
MCKSSEEMWKRPNGAARIKCILRFLDVLRGGAKSSQVLMFSSPLLLPKEGVTKEKR